MKSKNTFRAVSLRRAVPVDNPGFAEKGLG
jgi:hypothetical protein